MRRRRERQKEKKAMKPDGMEKTSKTRHVRLSSIRSLTSCRASIKTSIKSPLRVHFEVGLFVEIEAQNLLLNLVMP